MEATSSRAYEFGAFRLDPVEQRLTRNGEPVRVPPKALELLVALVKRAGKLVTKEELLSEVWPGTFVEEGNLAVNMFTLRRLLEDEDEKTCIETVPKRGYRFIAPVREVPLDGAAMADAAGAAAADVSLSPPSPAVPVALTNRAQAAIAPEVEPPALAPTLVASALPQAPAKNFFPRRAIALSLVVAGLGVVAGHFLWRSAQTPLPVFHQVTFRRGSVESARFASDGRTIVYSASWDGQPSEIFSVRHEYPESRSISAPSTVLASLSPAGELGILRNARNLHHTLWNGTLAKVPLEGGAPRDLVENAQGADWDPTATSSERIAIARIDEASNKMRLEFPPGKALYETPGWISQLRVSPKGDQVAFLDHPLPNDSLGSVVVVDSKANAKTLSTGWAAEAGLAWSPRGDEVWFSATRAGSNMAIYAVDLNGRLRELLSSAGRIILHDVSRDGRLLITLESVRSVLIFSHADGSSDRDLSWLDHSFRPHLSRDGKQLLFTEGASVAGPNYSVCLRNTDGSPVVRLGEGTAAGLSPDNKWVLAIVSALPGQMLLLPTGAGQSQPLERGPIENYSGGAWLPDGRRILFMGNEKAQPQHTYIEDIAEGRPRQVLKEAFVPEFDAISPDGLTVACRSLKGKYMLCPINGGEPQPLAGLNDGERPLAWTPDGRSLFVADLRKLPVQVYKLEPATGRRQSWKEIKPSDAAGLAGASGMVVTPDGLSFATTYVRVLSELYTVEGIR